MVRLALRAMGMSRLALLTGVACALCWTLVLGRADAAAVLPDHRGYELVSPSDKNGGDVISGSRRTRAATSGNAAGFLALTAFGDAIGTGVATDYMSVRTAKAGTSGWSTHAITPRQDPVSFFGDFNGMEPVYGGEFSPDLSTGIFRSWSPLTDAPNVATASNLYLRTDLLSAGAGSYQLMTDAIAPVSICSARW